ncbi:MAG: polysaccharide biosynthesis/export family protein [candidate division KSB1 bacterium]|nr:polysaccharide biosynthesis/export family protein [candidate division KSB1 bacterium]MDZ7341421.1 polysaccharide biosynthesis/export family protein [candidate division KSB1 bacterium]
MQMQIFKLCDAVKWRSLLLMVIGIVIYQMAIAGAKGGGSNEFYPGDAVRINVIELERGADRRTIDIGGDYTINSMGYIMLPLIGNVKVVGQDRVSLAKQLVEMYSPYLKSPYITTTPLIRLTLMGAFNKPGSYRINPESSLWELINMADGPKENCDLNSIRVERGGKVVIKNLLEEFERGHSLQDIGIRSGDQIISKGRSRLGIGDIMSYTYFVMSAVSLYFTIKNYNR